MCVRRYQPASASELLSAFRALDPDRTGTVSRECMESALRHDGEPFEDEELEEMMSAAAVETATGAMVIPYELYINKILVSCGDPEGRYARIPYRCYRKIVNSGFLYPPGES